MSKIEEESRLYSLLRSIIKFTLKKIYYREVYINNIENIPDNTPVMFAANHQNSLMDPFCIIISVKQQTIFLTRAGVFKSDRISKILNRFKMLPVYRLRDGFETIQKNKEIFTQCGKILENNRCLGIMPEGSHGDVKRLRKLQKGFVRVALDSEEHANYKLGVKVIPIGIEYKDVTKFRSRVLINVGEAINVSEFIPQYIENKQIGYKALNKEISNKLIPLMIHIKTDEIHDLLVRLRNIYNTRMQKKLNLSDKTFLSCFKADKIMIESFEEFYSTDPEQIHSLDKLTIEYTEGLKKLNLRDHLLENKNYPFYKVLINILLLLILFPLQLFAVINNYLPYKLPDWIINKIKPDSQFISTFRYVFSLLFFFPLFYIIIFIITLLVSGNIYFTLGYLIIASSLGLFAIHYWFNVKKLFGRLKFNNLVRKNDSKILSLIELREKIMKKTDEITDAFLK
ncbi:1-acyl-sn-glycerol-3-phosphate acyltransferase [Bacteroidota bacterium]